MRTNLMRWIFAPVGAALFIAMILACSGTSTNNNGSDPGVCAATTGQSCTDLYDCEVGEVCGGGQCVKTCSNDNQCSSYGGACVLENGGNNGGETCERDSECDSGQYCDAGFCEPGCRDGDCDEGFCDLGTRVCSVPSEPSCTDSVLNQDETDVDCGGGCTPCAQGQMCNSPADCGGDNATCDGTCDIPPSVRSSVPRAGEQHAEAATVTVEFSESIDASTVSSSSFRVAAPGEVRSLPGTLSAEGRTVTFTPSEPFAAGFTQYEVTLTTVIKDLQGTSIPEGSSFQFRTFAVRPGQYRIASTRDTGGGDRVGFGPGMNAQVEANSEGDLWNMTHLGGSRYKFRGANFNLELAVASGPGDTFDVGRGSDFRNAHYANGGTALSFVPTGEAGGKTYYQVSTGDGYTMQVACPSGYCSPANLQFKKGGDADAWFLIP